MTTETVPIGEQLEREDLQRAVEAYLEAARSQETAEAETCLKLARCYVRLDDPDSAYLWLGKVVNAGDHFPSWLAAASLLRQLEAQHPPAAKRSAKVALLSSYTSVQLAPLLRLAALRQGIYVELYQPDYGQYRQEIIDGRSRLYEFEPDFVIIAPHEGDLALPKFSQDPEEDVAVELSRWESLWRLVQERLRGRVIQHNFAIRPEQAMGHLGARLPGSRYVMTQMLNARLGQAAGSNVSILDCERLSSLFGKLRWFDDRYWYLSKQAVALDALPMLARHTVALLAAELGLSRKCLVLDLDNTLWGGVIGEEGLGGIKLGDGPEGEAFVALQEYILKLRDKGVILAACSKNNEADAREPFEKHPDMRLKLEDFAMFVANWDPKPDNLRRIARTLNIGLDSLVFVDDNPAEREVIRQLLPEVEVITLKPDPSSYTRSLSEYLLFETASYTPEDATRTAQYRARAEIANLEAAATSIEDFHRSLEMEALIAPFDELHLPRIAQLIGKTNQFNVTTRRHGISEIRSRINDPDWVHFYLKLRDRFTDHGLVGLLMAERRQGILDIDTWLMSCRVIGRTVEAEMLAHLCRRAEELGCSRLRGTYIPTAKNAMVADIYGQFGFDQVEGADGVTTWEYDLAGKGPIRNEFIRPWESSNEPA
ncbi:MAG: HAD-IIIC family phosphatase [Actinomycetota bacterium]|nr:HAD-IIIC family phosphatase [Actinomycetota bacterium]